MSKEKKKKRDWLLILLDFIIVVMVFVIVDAAFMLYLSVDFAKNSTSFGQNADLMSYELSTNNYAGMIQGRYINEFNGEKGTKSYCALAEYVEAASKYKVYVAKGKADKAGIEKATMISSREEMKELTIFADRIDRIFEVN